MVKSTTPANSSQPSMQTGNLRLQKLDNSAAIEALADFSDANWRQFPAYSAAAARQSGARDEYMGVYSGDSLIALANVRLKELPLVSGGIAFVSHGPVSMRGGEQFDPSRFGEIVALMADHYTRDLGYCLRIDSPVIPAVADQKMAAMASAGFQPCKRSTYQTFVIDLSADTDNLRKSLNGKWRTELNRAERQNLTVKRSTDPADFDAFAPLLDNLAQEKGFSIPQNAAFFSNVAKDAEQNERIILHMAYAGDDLVAGHVGAFSGNTAVYLLGAANTQGRDLRAAYLLQWAAITHAKSLNIGYYDLGGADEQENPSVFRFKKRMGGPLVENIPTYQIWPRQPGKAIISGAEWTYGKLRGRK